MAIGNRGFVQGLAGTISPSAGAARLPPRTGLLGERENRLAELATGKSVTRLQELIDPGRCRIWEGHNRDYAALTDENCADLIDSFKSEGRQNFPAIVRRVEGDPDHDYEVICGARRHWAVTWMRARYQPDFRFLVEPRELTDEEAFRLADLENRSRRDLSDYERAGDYARAVDRYYAGNQQRMADRLEVSKSWLSRYLELAKLPAEVLAAFASPHAVGISHAATLAPLLRAEDQKTRIIAEAQRITAEQSGRAARNETPLPPAAVTQRLVASVRAAASGRKIVNPREHVVRSAEGAVLARAHRGERGGVLTISVPTPAKHARSVLLGAIDEILNQMGQGAREERRGHR